VEYLFIVYGEQYYRKAPIIIMDAVNQGLDIDSSTKTYNANPCIFGATFGIQKEPQAFVYQRLAAFFLR
jgi:hypothetical protein